tara:strand:- start:59 stop:196 length:138 start_codon:yes stop_codon:yes gene_type:complete
VSASAAAGGAYGAGAADMAGEFCGNDGANDGRFAESDQIVLFLVQ